MKRKVPVSVAKGILSRVPFQVSFWLCTNENLRSLADVSDALQKATDDVFRYHVNRDKNDFEVWIRDVIKDKDLAREIARVKTRETLIRKITERVDELSSLVKRGVKSKPKPRPKRKAKPKHKKKVSRRKSGQARLRIPHVAKLHTAKHKAKKVQRRAKHVKRHARQSRHKRRR